MGFFSVEKQTYVNSVVYNLAGPPEQRPVYLKTTLMAGVMNPAGRSIADALIGGLLKGPGINLRSFGRWARFSGFSNKVGLTTGEFNIPASINHAVLQALVPVGIGETAIIKTASIGSADFTYWAHQYMLVNHPNLIDSAYTVNFNQTTGNITINFEISGSVSFTPTAYNKALRYLYYTYNIQKNPYTVSAVTGSTVVVANAANFPSTVGWSFVRTTVVGTLTTVMWQRQTPQGWNNAYSGTNMLREIMYQKTNSVGPVYSYQIDTQILVTFSFGPLQLVIYQRGNGIASLDALFQVNTDLGTFLPYIPVRVNNRFIASDFYGDIYAAAPRALRKSNGADYLDVIAKVAANPNIGDIDYAFAVYGVSLNTKDSASRRYIYEFFQECMLGRDFSGSGYDNWRELHDAATAVNNTYRIWFDAQFLYGNPLYGTAPPPQAVYPEVPQYDLRIRAGNQPNIGYDMTIGWNGIKETVGSGLAGVGRRTGELWWEVLARHTYQTSTYSAGDQGSTIEQINEAVQSHVKLYWQVTANSWRTIEIYGLYHKNSVYQGNYVLTHADAAIDLLDKESEFIIPLHEGIIKRMPLVESTQLSVSSNYLVFNAYRVVTQRWYETVWFKLIIFVVTIAIAIIAPYFMGPIAFNAAVATGTAAGVTSSVIAAAIAGSVINTLVAMMVSMVVGTILTEIAGPKLAAIIALALLVISMGTTISGTGVVSFSDFGTTFLNKLMEVENILKLTFSTVNVYSASLMEDAQSLIGKAEQVMLDYARDSKNIMEQTLKFDGAAPVLDPFMLTSFEGPTPGETPQMFLSRTLMTGSDIIELSNDLITRYTKIMLSTELPA